MAFTGRLGTLDSVLGRTLVLGVHTEGGSGGENEVVSTSVISLAVTADVSTTRPQAASALALSVTASAPKIHRKNASSTQSLTQAATGVGPYLRSLTDTLTLTQTAAASIVRADAESLLIITDVVRIAETHELSASSALALTSTGIGENLHGRASSALELEVLADTTLKRRSATSTLSLTSTAVGDKQRPASNTLTLTQSAIQGIVTLELTSFLDLEDLARIVNITVPDIGNTIEVTQEVTINIKMASITETIELNQALTVVQPWYVSAESEVSVTEQVFDLDTFEFVDVESGLRQEATAIFDGPRQLSNIISFLNQASAYVVNADAIAGDAESELTLTDEARLSKPVSNNQQTINLTQTATAQVGLPLVSQLSTLAVAANVVVVRGNLTASNTISIVDAVGYVFEQGNTLCLYSPFVGSTSDPNAPTPPPTTYTEAHGTPGFRLQYPSTGTVTDELILRAPNLGNRDRLSMVRVNRETRGGTLIVFADPIWPKVETLLLSFSGLSSEESQDLLAFMESHIGQEIRLIDWEDRLWTGVIINPQDPIVQDGPGCRYTASFEFEGQKA